MTRQIQKIIEALGYSPKEAKVYLATLALGESHISDIAEKVQLPRTSVQVIIDKLCKDGLVNFYVMRRYKYWVAENPERLLRNLEQREEAIREALPELFAIRKKNKGKRYSKNLNKSIALLHMLADTSVQPVLIANDEAQIVYVNSAWEKQFGYALKEVKGENPRILQSGKTPVEVYRRMGEYLQKEKMFQTDEIIDRRKDGTLINLLTTLFPVRHDNHLFYIQISDDISEKKRADALRGKFVTSATAMHLSSE